VNERMLELASKAEQFANLGDHVDVKIMMEKFAQLIAGECAEICLEMAAKCAGLPGDGALAKDCAYWIKKDFGVEE